MRAEKISGKNVKEYLNFMQQFSKKIHYFERKNER